MMPEFIFNETGLSKEIVGFYPKSPKLVYFKMKKPTKIFQDSIELEKEQEINGVKREELVILEMMRIKL